MPVPIPGGLAGVSDGFDPMPKGIYAAEVTDCTVSEATGDGKSPKGTPVIKWEFTIHEEEYDGRKAWLNNTLTEKAMPIFKGTLRGLGATDEEMDNLSEFDEDEWIGKQVRIQLKVGVNPKTDQPNNSVVRVLPLSEEESELPTG